jgi:hypothetical protein
VLSLARDMCGKARSSIIPRMRLLACSAHALRKARHSNCTLGGRIQCMIVGTWCAADARPGQFAVKPAACAAYDVCCCAGIDMVPSTRQRLPVPPSAADCRAGRQQTAPAQVTKTEAECGVMVFSSYERITHACIKPVQALPLLQGLDARWLLTGMGLDQSVQLSCNWHCAAGLWRKISQLTWAGLVISDHGGCWGP